MIRLLCALVALGSLLLTSCIEGDEVIWLERDGSGRIEAVYKMPTRVAKEFGGPEALAKKLEDAAAGDKHVDLTRVAHRTEKGQVTFEFAGTFDSLQKLTTFPQRRLRDPAAPDTPVQAEALFGESSLTINALTIQLSRKVDISGVIPDNIKKFPAILGESNFHYTVHLPTEVDQTDAATISDDGRTIEWTFLLKEHLDKEMSLFAKAPLPLPWWIWFAGVLLVIAFLAVLFLAIRRMILMRK